MDLNRPFAQNGVPTIFIKLTVLAEINLGKRLYLFVVVFDFNFISFFTIERGLVHLPVRVDVLLARKTLREFGGSQGVVDEHDFGEIGSRSGTRRLENGMVRREAGRGQVLVRPEIPPEDLFGLDLGGVGVG